MALYKSLKPWEPQFLQLKHREAPCPFHTEAQGLPGLVAWSHGSLFSSNKLPSRMTPASVSISLTLFINPSSPCSLGFAPYSPAHILHSGDGGLLTAKTNGLQASICPLPPPTAPPPLSLSLNPCPVPQHGALLIRPPPRSTVVPRPLGLKLASVSSSLPLLLLPGVRCDPRPPSLSLASLG